MKLPVKGFTDIVRDMSAALGASAGKLIDVSIGSVLRAIIDANAAIVLWAQWLVLLTLQTTRAATSSGSDLDSWMADFSLFRLPAKQATGSITFSRLSGANTAFVPLGTVLKTGDSSVSFAVTVDVNNPSWQATQNGYSLAIGVQSLQLPIASVAAGAVGNVLPNTITVIASALPGVDFVNNELGTNGGEDAEADAALRTRFGNFFAARSRATLDAIGYAISLVGQNLSYVVQENIDVSGNRSMGTILIIVDDGSGILSDSLRSSLSSSLSNIRPLGTIFSIQPPQIIPVRVSFHITCPLLLSLAATQDKLQSAIGKYIDQQPIGGMLSITRISQLAYQVEPRLLNISEVTLNEGDVDLVASAVSAFKTQNVQFS